MGTKNALGNMWQRMIGYRVARREKLERNFSSRINTISSNIASDNRNERIEQQSNVFMEENDKLISINIDVDLKNKLQDKVDFYTKIIKELIKDKYDLMDKLDETSIKDYKLICPICEGLIDRDLTQKHTSECVFLGGKLERYSCNTCGAIVGPVKMLKMSPEELSKDYVQSYSVFSEGDSTAAEKEAFYSLNPTKEGCYLNYGCGDWSHSIKELREEGYCVYGYEPYASITNEPYIIKSEEVLKTMKFDGIFSNNVLEHLADPIERFLFFGELLKDNTCLMAHSTPCYEYCYEYTRFHLVFYTGKSLEYLCEKTGFSVDGIIKKDPPQDFYNVIYRKK